MDDGRRKRERKKEKEKKWWWAHSGPIQNQAQVARPSLMIATEYLAEERTTLGPNRRGTGRGERHGIIALSSDSFSCEIWLQQGTTSWHHYNAMPLLLLSSIVVICWSCFFPGKPTGS